MRPTTKLRRAAAGVLLAALVLGGCADDGDEGRTAEDEATESASETTEPTGTPTEEDTLAETDWGRPASGATMKGKGYSYRIPPDWTDITRRARAIQRSLDTAAAEKSPDDGFGDNVNVGLNAAPGFDLDGLAREIPQEMSAFLKGFEELPRVTIDGVEALHHRGRAASGPTKYVLEQFATVDEDGTVTIISFSFSPDLGQAQRDRTMGSVLASWRWAR